MKKIFLLLLMILTFSGCGDANEDSKHVNSMKYRKILTVGIDEGFAPMGFRNEAGEIVGFDVDLAKEAARRMGTAVEFRPIDWNNKEMEILSGNVDMIWNGLDIVDDYKEYMIFSKPYMDNRQILLFKKGNAKDIQSEYDLKGKIVATQAGSNSELYIDDNEDLKASFAAFKTYSNIQDAFESLINDEYDVIIIDEIAGRYEMTIHPDKFETVEVTVGDFTEFGIGFRKEDVKLRDRVQKAFDDMVADGTAKRISEQWFQADLIKLEKRY